MLVALYGYTVASRTQYDQLDVRLRDITDHVATEFATASDQEARVAVLEGARGFGVRVALYDSAARWLRVDRSVSDQHTSDFAAVNPAQIVAAPTRAAYGPITALAPVIRPTSSGNGAFGLVEVAPRRSRVFVLPVAPFLWADGRSVHYVVGVESLTELDSSLRRVLLLMMLIAALGNIVTFGTGWLLAGRALRPVLRLTSAASTIARSGAFSQRVPTDLARDELGQLAVTFNEMLERLERAHAAQAQFIADASHELRAPVTVVKANLELLQREPPMNQSDQKGAVHEAHLEAERLGRLVANLLLLARADAGVPKRHGPVDLSVVVRDVLVEARHLAPGRKITVITLDSVVVDGDADALKQLLLNLVENAIKYTPAEGLISVALRRDDATAIVEIRDSGHGISSADLPRVFERFFRADRARTRNATGTGLGLPIALWIARQHDGDILLTSELGQGTLATVRIPVRSQGDYEH